MNTYEILIDIIDQAIIDDDIDTLKENLPRLPFEKLNQQNLDLLLARFINLTISEEVVKQIFKTWYDYLEVERGQLDHLTRLFTDITVAEDKLALVAKTFDDKPMVYYFQHLIDYDSLPMTIIAAKNLERVFTSVVGEWEYLFDRAVENELQKGYTNRLIKDFIENKLTEFRSYPKKPKYIVNHYAQIPSIKTLRIDNTLDYETSLTLALKDITDDEVEKVLGDDTYDYLNANDKEKIKLLRPHMLNYYQFNMTFDEDMFRAFGPVNSQLSDFKDHLNKEDKNHVCRKYGGHRMLLCKEFEPLYIEDEEVDNNEQLADWFTGRCDRCFNPIEHRHYALRQPIYNGGWIGTYCSFKCLKIDVPKVSIVYELITIFEEQVKRIGIQDRTY